MDNRDRVDELFKQALEMSGAERGAFLDRECGDDHDLRDHVERLVTGAESDSWLQTGGGIGESLFEGGDTLASGSSVGHGEATHGRYRLIGKVGEGGMGEVYEAVQEEPLRRRVAIKLIKPGMQSKKVVARFKAERQAIGLMTHPNIAKVFDAGVTADGRPFFVMEFVPGLAITEYCDRHRLDIDQRLALFLAVCAGVQHAHQKAIIHRDLKPSNILVSIEDGKPVPRIIDFGVAKAIAQPLTEETLYTQAGQIVGSPAYMSPEQAEFTAIGIDTRSDIYSLGTILYEMLTGMHPLDMIERMKDGVQDGLRALRESEPVPPSARVASIAGGGAEEAERRGSTPAALAGRLRGDLDWITIKALQKDPARRYDSASDFAKDIERHLQDEPVLAGPPSALYRFGKFARRHRVGLAVAGAIGLGVLIGAAGLTYALFESDRQRAEAQKARDESEAVTSFLQQMLAAANPDEYGPAVSVRDILDDAAVNVEEQFRDRPMIQARLRNTIGNSYRTLGDYEKAETHLEQAVETQKRLLGPDHINTLHSMVGLALYYQYVARYEESESLYVSALRQFRSRNEPDNVAMYELIGHLARLYQVAGRLDESETLYEEAVGELNRIAGPDDKMSLSVVNNYSLLFLNQGRFDQAEPMLRDQIERHERVHGPEHPTTLNVKSNLALTLQYTDRFAEAESVYTSILGPQREILGRDHQNTLSTFNNLALVYKSLGRYEDAEAMSAEVLDIQRRLVGENHPRTIISLGNLGDLLTEASRPAEGEPYLREAVSRARAVLPEGHAIRGASIRKLGVCLTALARYDEAEKTLLEAYESLRAGLGPDHQRTQHAVRDLVALYRASGRDEEAADWFAKVPAS